MFSDHRMFADRQIYKYPLFHPLCLRVCRSNHVYQTKTHSSLGGAEIRAKNERKRCVRCICSVNSSAICLSVSLAISFVFLANY